MSTEANNANSRGPEAGQRPRKFPWHFKAFFVAAVAYLGYRLYQGIEWLIHHI